MSAEMRREICGEWDLAVEDAKGRRERGEEGSVILEYLDAVEREYPGPKESLMRRLKSFL